MPVAYATAYPPCPGRSLWALLYDCPVCTGTHFGRAPEMASPGRRRARCGAMLWLEITAAGDGEVPR